MTEWPLPDATTGRKQQHITTRYKPDIMMETVLYHATTIAVLAVIIVLVLGLRSMMKGDSPNFSQKLMRWRVGLQFLAILIIVAYALIAH